MATRSVVEKWLAALTGIPTASGVEHRVIDWVTGWVARRPDLRLKRDAGGNLLVTQEGRHRLAPVIAVAHMDHPGFVIDSAEGAIAHAGFRGGVRAEYFADASVEFVTGRGRSGRVVEYTPESHRAVIAVSGPTPEPGDIARWRFRPRVIPAGRFAAPACDDLAGCAASLAALDRRRRRPEMAHFGVLLTRAEEMGFVGALHAATEGTIPADARVLSVETSRASADAPIGGGPVIRVGDASTVFDSELTNLVTEAARSAGIRHQRRLMAGGSCEATAFGGLGYRAAGLCLALGNYHNMGNLDEVETGTGAATPMTEEISVDDFHALVDLILLAGRAVDGESTLPARLRGVLDEGRDLLT